MMKEWQTEKAGTPSVPPTEQPEVPQASPIDADLPKLRRLKDKFSFASKRTGVPEDILAGIASRETHAGRSLPQTGYGGKDNKMFGIMQINSEVHGIEGAESPESKKHITQAARILKEYKGLMDKRFPNWPEEQRWRAAVAGYNAGPNNVKDSEVDKYTDGHDYSKDVMERAKAYRSRKDQ